MNFKFTIRPGSNVKFDVSNRCSVKFIESKFKNSDINLFGLKKKKKSYPILKLQS